MILKTFATDIITEYFVFHRQINDDINIISCLDLKLSQSQFHSSPTLQSRQFVSCDWEPLKLEINKYSIRFYDILDLCGILWDVIGSSRMGNKHTLEDDLITFKLTSKQFGRDGALIMVTRFFDMENFILCPNTHAFTSQEMRQKWDYAEDETKEGYRTGLTIVILLCLQLRIDDVMSSSVALESH